MVPCFVPRAKPHNPHNVLFVGWAPHACIRQEEREDERATRDPEYWKKVARGGVSYYVNTRTREIRHDNPFPTGTTIKPSPPSPVGTGGPMLYQSDRFRTDPIMK